MKWDKGEENLCIDYRGYPMNEIISYSFFRMEYSRCGWIKWLYNTKICC